jgi:small GTP-binding protein
MLARIRHLYPPLLPNSRAAIGGQIFSACSSGRASTSSSIIGKVRGHERKEEEGVSEQDDDDDDDDDFFYETEKDQRCLGVAIVGLPNAGKSTLLNELLGSKVSAVSPKRNTTRSSMLGYLTQDMAQLVFWDTPGFIGRQDAANFQRELYTSASESMREVDVTVAVLDAARRMDDRTAENTKVLFKQAMQSGSEFVLVMNKVFTLLLKTHFALSHT